MYKYETHMHTSEVSPCARSTAAEQVKAYKENGYTGIIVTDHFPTNHHRFPSWAKKIEFLLSGYETAKKEGEKIGLDVFFGWEYRIYGSDFLTYGLSLDFLLANPKIEEMDIKRYCELIRGNGGFVVQAHPFREGGWIPHPFPTNPQYIDGIEVFNASILDEENQKAVEFAKKNDLPMQAGSDAHDAQWPFLSGVTLKSKATDIFDIITAIKTKQAELILPVNNVFINGMAFPDKHNN